MKKIIRHSNAVIFPNKDFQTILVHVVFPFKREEKNIAMMQLLPNMLHNMSMKYPSEREYSLEMQKRYILSCQCSTGALIEHSYFAFDLMVPDVLSLGKDMLDEQFEFFSQMIFHPKVYENAFTKKEFTREVENLKVDIDKALKDTGTFALVKAREILDPSGVYSDTIYNHQDQIDEVTVQNLYQFYKEKILENDPFIYVFGNVDENKIQDLCHKYLYRRSLTDKEFYVPIRDYLPLKDKVDSVTMKSDFRNSVYVSFYKVKDMKEDDEILLSTVQALLSSASSRILHTILRTENDLVYSVSSTNSNHYGFLGIVAFIHKEHLEEVKEKIDEALNKLKNEDEIKDALKNIKERSRINLIRRLDDKLSLFRDQMIEDLGIDRTRKEVHELLLKVTPKDIHDFMNRLILDSQFFLEEGDYE